VRRLHALGRASIVKPVPGNGVLPSAELPICAGRAVECDLSQGFIHLAKKEVSR
jgi:hypothetical protein